MRAVCFIAVIALASAVAPPRISLNLEGMTNAYKLKDSIERAHDLKYTQNDGTKVGSRQDWTEKCPANLRQSKSAFKATCPFPVAKGYDHHDQEVTVSTRIYLVDDDNKAISPPRVVTAEQVDHTKRSTYLFKYDAMDKAGNKAEQVVFALILDDTTAPVFGKNCETALTVEAATDWYLCKLRSRDNIDLDLTEQIRYRIQKAWGKNNKCNQNKNCGPVELGKFLVTATSADKAGVYGHNAKDNVATMHVAIVVKDTRAPVIQINGHSPVFHECISKKKFAKKALKQKYQYYDSGADALDLYDTWALKKTTQKYTATINGKSIYNIKAQKPVLGHRYFNEIAGGSMRTTRIIKFNAKDENNNKAKEAVRAVTTIDTVAPTLTLKGDKSVDRYEQGFKMYHHSTKSTDGTQPSFASLNIEAGVHATDLCDDENLKISYSWGPREFNVRKLGHYVRTYSTIDQRKNKAKVVRTFNVIDEEVPTINVVGHTNAPETFEATRDLEYTDKGATCNDYVDGELSHAVEVSGEVVNMRIPGTYVIRYDCTDLSGNNAETKTRTVVIEDTLCPHLKLSGPKVNYVEAGFPYVDLGATATDTLDGDITQYIWTDGNTVNHKQAFYSRRSCDEIKKGLVSGGMKNPEKHSGEYYITTVRTFRGKQRFHRQLVHCWMRRRGVKAVTFKIFQLADCEALAQEAGEIASDCHKQMGCELIGMVQNKEPSRELINYINDIKADALKGTNTNKNFADVFNLNRNGKSVPTYGDSTYLCKEQARVNTDTQWVGDNVERGVMKITNAEQGKYVIGFYVSDKAGNHQCNRQMRTVIVKDTLPPVITLHLGKKLIHVGAHDQKGLDGQSNRAGEKKYNPYLMAEVTTTNGWVMAAVASAISGVALLGYSMRRTTTSVPV